MLKRMHLRTILLCVGGALIAFVAVLEILRAVQGANCKTWWARRGLTAEWARPDAFSIGVCLVHVNGRTVLESNVQEKSKLPK